MSKNTRGKNSAAASNQIRPQELPIVEVKPDVIRRRAYEIFQARNGGPGDQASDWAQAERELNGAVRNMPAVVRHDQHESSNAY